MEVTRPAVVAGKELQVAAAAAPYLVALAGNKKRSRVGAWITGNQFSDAALGHHHADQPRAELFTLLRL